jgi:hypothetical protein
MKGKVDKCVNIVLTLSGVESISGKKYILYLMPQ